MDMMARYTFSTFCQLPRRLPPAAAFVMAGGGQTRRRWLLNNRIITISTSGGGHVGPAGLCQACLGRVRGMTAPPGGQQQLSTVGGGARVEGRRRHKSAAAAAAASSSGLSRPVRLKPLSQDDMLLNRCARLYTCFLSSLSSCKGSLNYVLSILN